MTRILVAEDSPTQAFQIQTKLVDEGYEVQMAGDGQQALEMVPKFWPHLILTDMEMPVMPGLELVEICTTQYPAIPIILITAKGSDTTAVEALERGAAAYLPKSLLDEKLFATIDEVLDVMEADNSYAQLIQSMDYNEFRFTLENKEELIRPLVELVQQMAGGLDLCDDTGRVRLGMAVDHALRNALLHGNLQLSPEEIEADGELIVSGEPTLVERRRAEPEFCDRRIHVTAKLSPERAEITVRDDGNGFDHSSLPDPKEELADDTGRGLVLIRSMMDEVQFNDQGNEITMLKYRDAEA
ncbi:MAG: response regulator [Pirellulaceae bacterium]|nr:response regulator [Pirellulaceae bacterium]